MVVGSSAKLYRRVCTSVDMLPYYGPGSVAECGALQCSVERPVLPMLGHGHLLMAAVMMQEMAAGCLVVGEHMIGRQYVEREGVKTAKSKHTVWTVRR